jgi:hypothetical protein
VDLVGHVKGWVFFEKFLYGMVAQCAGGTGLTTHSPNAIKGKKILTEDYVKWLVT